jgi:hypothetical protein
MQNVDVNMQYGHEHAAVTFTFSIEFDMHENIACGVDIARVGTKMHYPIFAKTKI